MRIYSVESRVAPAPRQSRDCEALNAQTPPASRGPRPAPPASKRIVPQQCNANLGNPARVRLKAEEAQVSDAVDGIARHGAEDL